MAQTLILASGSPRRRALLGELGVPFRVIVSDAPETLDPTLDAEAQAVALAERKANTVAPRLPSGLVLSADTIVVLSGQLLGKPRAALIADYNGCFTNVVGLPLCETALLLEQAGLAVDRAAPVCLLPDGAPCPRLV